MEGGEGLDRRDSLPDNLQHRFPQQERHSGTVGKQQRKNGFTFCSAVQCSAVQCFIPSREGEATLHAPGVPTH